MSSLTSHDLANSINWTKKDHDALLNHLSDQIARHVEHARQLARPAPDKSFASLRVLDAQMHGSGRTATLREMLELAD